MGILKFISDKLYANDKEVALVEDVQPLDPNHGITYSSNYTKFPDGTLICYGTVGTAAFIDQQSDIFGDTSGVISRAGKTITFPVPFSSPPIITTGLTEYGGATVWARSATTHDFTFQIFYTASGFKGNWIAMGRWK